MTNNISGFSRFFTLTLSKLRNALIYSVVNLSTNELIFDMQFNDVLLIFFGLYFISEIYISIKKANHENYLIGRWGFITYLFHTISRQSVFVISEVTSRKFSVGSNHDAEGTFILIFLTCFFVIIVVLLPDWFLRCDERGSLKSILLFSICSRFNIIKIAGFGGAMGTFVYGGFYLVTTSIMHHFRNRISEFRMRLLSAFAMIWSNLFIVALIPSSKNNILPFVCLLTLYTLASSFELFQPVEGFCLWKVSVEIRDWILALSPSLHSTEIILIVSISSALTSFTNIVKLQMLSIMCVVQVTISQILTFTGEHNTNYSFVLSIVILVVVDILLIRPEKKSG